MSNCVLSIPGFGAAQVRATQVAYGMDVISYSPDGQSRTGATFYPAKRVDSDMDLTLIFSSRANCDNINKWLQRYVDQASDPSAVSVPVRITLPSRNFDMTAVLKSGITFGRQVGEVTCGMTLSFVGARSPMSLKSTQISSFALPRSKAKDLSLVYFYPGGTQLQGAVFGWDTFYDDPKGLAPLNDGYGPLNPFTNSPQPGA